jgi:transcription termination/antitermination protein NusA
MKNEFILAFNEVLEEKQLPREVILKALESAMVSAYRRSVNASSAQQVEARIDPETGKVVIFAEKEVVESVQDPRTEASIQEAKRYNPEAEIGSMVVVESTPTDFGRVAAQTARQVIQQRIRDAERQAQLAFYQKQLGEIVSGIVQAINAQGLTIGMEMRAEGNMARKDMIPGERFRIHDRVRSLIAEVKDTPRGPQIVLSRTHRDFLRRLLENEVPEIYHGVVEIRSIAREPGERAKVAVSATQQGIDPVGACVGIRGVRIQAIVRELHDEKIDVIEWNSDPAVFIAKAISPARVVGVYLTERSGVGKTATVVVPEDQLSLAIGRDGQNARLAAKLTSWRIDIKSVSESVSDMLYRLQKEPEFAELAAVDANTITSIEAMLAKKAEGRPLNPEEYDQMGQFVDRIERRVARRLAVVQPVHEDKLHEELRTSLPEAVYKQNILDVGLSEHVAYILQEGGYSSLGELYVQIKIQPDEILKLQGISPRSMAEISRVIETVDAGLVTKSVEPEPVETAVPAEEEMVQTIEKPEIVEPTSTEVSQSIETLEPVTAPAEAVSEQTETVENQEEEEPSFDKLFSLRPEVIKVVDLVDEDEDEESRDSTGKKKKKKARKHTEIEYDPDRDLTLVTKKHKRGEGFDWE